MYVYRSSLPKPLISNLPQLQEETSMLKGIRNTNIYDSKFKIVKYEGQFFQKCEQAQTH